MGETTTRLGTVMPRSLNGVNMGLGGFNDATGDPAPFAPSGVPSADPAAPAVAGSCAERGTASPACAAARLANQRS